ncbi:MAG: 30S ribosomal protein S2 [Candidatus Omnitrophica bacterium]|nr:30S ribosomal protein S2 [Candidatus Omnitrophota bacterium]
MSQVTIKQLLEAGVHFGHQTQRWNPKMKKYIFGARNGIYIINLEITLSCMETALNFLKQTTLQGKEVLFVGTKRQAQEPIRLAADSCGMPYVDQRWLGGMLTNFETVRKSVKKLESIDEMEREGNFQFVTKKEVMMLKKEREKLLKNLRGVKNMKSLPSALFVIDSKKEEIAIHEAVTLGIPVVAVLDTNGNPDVVDYPIPGNDDAIRSVKLFCDLISGAIKEGRSLYLQTTAPSEEPSSEEAETEIPSAIAPPEAASETGDILSAEVVPETVEDPIEEQLASRFGTKEVSLNEIKPITKVKPKRNPRKEGGKVK